MTPNKEQPGIDLDKLEALAKAATPGPWTCFNDSVEAESERQVAHIMTSDYGPELGDPACDAAFIAAANPVAVRNLITLARSAITQQAEAPQAGAADSTVTSAADTPASAAGELIAAAEKKAEAYDGDDREGIKTDVINAFYQGAAWQARATLAPVAAQPSHIEYDRIVKADKRALRAVDALDGMGFTYDEEIGWLAPVAAQQAAAPVQPILANGLPIEQTRFDWVARVISENSIFDGEDIHRAWNELVAFYVAHKQAAAKAPAAQAKPCEHCNEGKQLRFEAGPDGPIEHHDDCEECGGSGFVEPEKAPAAQAVDAREMLASGLREILASAIVNKNRYIVDLANECLADLAASPASAQGAAQADLREAIDNALAGVRIGDGSQAEYDRLVGEIVQAAAQAPVVREVPDEIPLPGGAFLQRETRTSGQPGWLLRGKSRNLIRALNLAEVELVESALAASTATVTAPAQPAEQQLCPACHGSGEGVMMEGQGPDAYEVPCACAHCKGSGDLLDAYNGVVELLRVEHEKYMKACGEIYRSKLAAPAAQQADDLPPDVEFKRLADTILQATTNGARNEALRSMAALFDRRAAAQQAAPNEKAYQIAVDTCRDLVDALLKARGMVGHPDNVAFIDRAIALAGTGSAAIAGAALAEPVYLVWNESQHLYGGGWKIKSKAEFDAMTEEDKRMKLYRAAPATAGMVEDAKDAARLDFLEQIAERKEDSMPNIRAFGKTFVAETLREAIDAALAAQQAQASAKDE